MSYFLSGVLDTAGVTDVTTQANLFVAMNAVQIIISSIGCMFVDRIGRRPLLIWVNVGCGIVWIAVTTAAGIQAKKHDMASSVATVAFIYIFQAVYSFGWTPLQALYPVEVLSYEMRAKGMAFSSLFTSCGTLVNQFGFPVALEKIAWKTYIVFIIWCFIQSFIIYIFMPETKNRTVSLPPHKWQYQKRDVLTTCPSSLRNLMTSSTHQTRARHLPQRSGLKSTLTLTLLLFKSWEPLCNSIP